MSSENNSTTLNEYLFKSVLSISQDCRVNVNAKNNVCRVQGCHDRHIVSELLHLAKQIDLPTAQQLFQATKAVEGFGLQFHCQQTMKTSSRKKPGSNRYLAELGMMYTILYRVDPDYPVSQRK